MNLRVMLQGGDVTRRNRPLGSVSGVLPGGTSSVMDARTEGFR
jgi:hypothetical protein